MFLAKRPSIWSLSMKDEDVLLIRHPVFTRLLKGAAKINRFASKIITTGMSTWELPCLTWNGYRIHSLHGEFARQGWSQRMVYDANAQGGAASRAEGGLHLVCAWHLKRSFLMAKFWFEDHLLWQIERKFQDLGPSLAFDWSLVLLYAFLQASGPWWHN